MFDESLNKELQKKQIDILIRTWHDNKISSRYYLSDFLGHACAVNILDTFEKHIELAIPKHDKYIDLVSPQDIVFARSESGNIC
jgi:hypothetical protein